MKIRLELWQLRYFVAVAEELNFRRAAERLSITQPPLTRQIQALEATLGEPLFERGPAGVTMTDAGRRLLADARQLLALADDLFARLDRRSEDRRRQSTGQPIRPSQQHKPLRLGITTVVDASLLTWLEPALKKSAPHLQLVQTRQVSQRSVAALQKGTLDLAIIGLPSVTTGLVVETLTLDPLVAAIPERHRLGNRKSLSLVELGDDRLFWFPRSLNPAYFDHFEALFRRIGFAPTRRPEPPDHHVLLSLIADGQGVALIPKSLTSIARAGVSYKTLKPTEGLAIGIAAAYRPGNLDESAMTLLASLRAHFGSR